MIPLFRLYGWAITAGSLAAMTLGLLGCWLAARDRAMQTLCLGQGATLGVLIGLGILPWTGLVGEPAHFVPFVVAILASLFTFWVTEQVVRGRTASKNTFYSFIFAVLMSLAYLVSALFPALESHMSQVFFGDLATLSDHDAAKAIVLSATGILLLGRRWKAFSNQAFETSVLGMGRKERAKKGRRLFEIIAFSAICFSVQYLGFLFTIACLFVPTSLMLLSGMKGLRSHLVFSSGLATISTLVGFLISLSATRLPTVPTIVVLMLTLGLLLGLPRVWAKS